MTPDAADDTGKLSLNWVSTPPKDGGTVLLLHAVGYDLTYWDRQIEVLESRYRVVAMDLPGHGRSSGTAAEWSFAMAVRMVADLIGDLGDGPVHLVGISFGGMIAQYVAFTRPDLVRSLTLIGTACTFAETAQAGMRARAATIREQGMEAVLVSSLERWFTAGMRQRRPDVMDRVAKTVLADDPAVQAAIWEMVAALDVRDKLSEIRCPTLILVGEQDPSTPPDAAALLRDGIAGAEMLVLPDTSHLATIESPDAVNAALVRFLDAQ